MELPTISDKQKKILKSGVVALGIVLVLLILGIIFSKQKDQILKGVVDSQNAVTDNSKGEGSLTQTGLDVVTTATKAKASDKVVSFLRSFFTGDTFDSLVSKAEKTSVPVLDTIQKDLTDYKNTLANKGTLQSGLNKYGLASDDPRFIKQLQEAHDQYSTLQDQLHTATQQLQSSQNQITGYQSGATGASGALFQATTGSVQDQLSQYQTQVANLQAQTTLAGLQMAYYFCQGIPSGVSTGAGQNITLAQIADGSFQVINDDGSFNYQVCGSLLSLLHDLPNWLQSQGSNLQLTNYIPYLQQLIQSATFFYCPLLGGQSQPSGTQITLGGTLNQISNYTPPQCPTAQNTGGISTAVNSATNYNNVSLAITSIAPNPVLTTVPVTLSWYATGVDQNSCALIDVTNDPSNFGTGTVIAVQKPAIGSFEFTPTQILGERTIGVQCTATQNGATQVVTDKEKITIVQPTTAPFVALSISDNDILAGDPSPKLTWTSAALLSNKCSLYKNGIKVFDNLSVQSANYQLPIETSVGTFFYQLLCQSEQNSIITSNSVMYTVTQPGAIAIDLKVNNQDSLTFSGAQQNLNFTWTQTGTVNSCVGSFAGGQLPGSYSGTSYAQTATTSKYFTISCVGAGNQKASDVVLIQKIASTQLLPITVDLKINNQNGITQTTTTPFNGVFTWSSTGPVTSCTSNFVPASLSVVLPSSYSGSNYTKSINDSSFYTISCTGASGQKSSDTVLVTMGSTFASQVLYTNSNIQYTQSSSYTSSNSSYQNSSNYTFINYWAGTPPWTSLLELVVAELKKLLVGMLVYTQLYVVPIVNNFPADVWQPRSDLSVTVDPQKSYVEEGEMYITGRVSSQKYEVRNLAIDLRYGTIPGIITKSDATTMAGTVTKSVFKKAFLQKKAVDFYRVDSQLGTTSAVNVITLPPKSSVLFSVRVSNLDKDKPYFFDLVDSSTLVPVLKSLNR